MWDRLVAREIAGVRSGVSALRVRRRLWLSSRRSRRKSQRECAEREVAASRRSGESIARRGFSVGVGVRESSAVEIVVYRPLSLVLVRVPSGETSSRSFAVTCDEGVWEGRFREVAGCNCDGIARSGDSAEGPPRAGTGPPSIGGEIVGLVVLVFAIKYEFSNNLLNPSITFNFPIFSYCCASTPAPLLNPSRKNLSSFTKLTRTTARPAPLPLPLPFPFHACDCGRRVSATYALSSQADGAPMVEVIRVSEEELGWRSVSVRVTMAARRAVVVLRTSRSC